MFRFYPFVKRVSNSDSIEGIIDDFWKNGFINGFIYGTLTSTFVMFASNAGKATLFNLLKCMPNKENHEIMPTNCFAS